MITSTEVKLPYTFEDFTAVEEACVWVCNNCGAYGHHLDYIKHHSGCTPGAAKWWEEHPEMYDDGKEK